MKYEAGIIKELTNVDPTKRPSAQKILKMAEYKAWKKEVYVEDDD